MKAMILAAGYGTRFRPATYATPKPMVPVCNRPLIGYAVDALVASGVRDIVVNLHHLPQQIEDYLRATYLGVCDFEFSMEPEILGTGGGVRKARPYLGDEETFYLVNGDTIQFPPFNALLEARQRSGAVAALLLRHPPVGDRFTSVFYREGLVTGIGGTAEGEPLMFAGTHALGRAIFDVLPDRDFSGITEDVYIPLLASGRDGIAGVVDDGLWFDIGTPSRYLGASEAILDEMIEGSIRPPAGTIVEPRAHSVFSYDAEVKGRVERSAIGSESIVEPGAIVRRSVIWRDCTIQRQSQIVDSILAEDVDLPRGAVAENVLVAKAIPGTDYPETIDVVEQWAVVPIDAGKPHRFEV